MKSHPKRPRDPNQLAKSIIDKRPARSPTAILRPRKRVRTRQALWRRLAGMPLDDAGTLSRFCRFIPA
jgi:hypothetical protein